MLYYLYTLYYPSDLKACIKRSFVSTAQDATHSSHLLASAHGKLAWTYDIELFKVVDKLVIRPLAKMAKSNLDELCTRSGLPVSKNKKKDDYFVYLV